MRNNEMKLKSHRKQKRKCFGNAFARRIFGKGFFYSLNVLLSGAPLLARPIEHRVGRLCVVSLAVV